MAKLKSTHFCSNCGFESAKWLGKCPSCQSWNTLVEEVVEVRKGNASIAISGPLGKAKKPVLLGEAQMHEMPRIQLPGQELNRILGNGLMPGSVVLIGGEPGIGKSTLLLQLAIDTKLKVLYVSGEESEVQIQQRAQRIGLRNNQCYLLAETATQNILKEIEEIQPELIIIDSVQTLHSAVLESSAGSVGQIRQSAAELIHLAKQNNIPVFLVGHITKDGAIAGPKVLEHMVDTVLQFEGDRKTGLGLPTSWEFMK